jgi:Glycosyl transferase family 2
LKTIALLPVRNEAWVLRHSLACLSAFCDVVLVNDQASDDDTRDICRQFSNVVLMESRDAKICEEARWELLEAARDYDGHNLIWCTDADELVSPTLVRAFLARERDRLVGGAIVECRYYHVWDRPDRYRDSVWPYIPYWKPIAIVDDRRADYSRARSLPLHEERVPIDSAASRVQGEQLPVLHLQWLLPRRNQVRQAWYRCREWLHGERPLREINLQYSFTLPNPRVATRPIPRDWVADVTFPDAGIDATASWQERDILGWFNERGPEFFEPLEIWHIPVFHEAFVRAVGRAPRFDRSHYPSFYARAHAAASQIARRVVGAARRRFVTASR